MAHTTRVDTMCWHGVEACRWPAHPCSVPCCGVPCGVSWSAGKHSVHLLVFVLSMLTMHVSCCAQDDVGVILSACQRLGVMPPPEWQNTLATAFLSTVDTEEKAKQVRSDFYVKPLVGLAGMGWKPTPEQWQVLVTAAQALLPMGYFRGRQLLETAWAFAQFGNPVSRDWSQVGAMTCLA